jgi:hypothetical protein
MAIERAQIIAWLVPQPGQNTSSQGRSSEQRSTDRRRPQHVPAGRQPPIPSVDDGLGLLARGPVRLELGSASLDVERSCPDAHGASITTRAPEVDPAFFALCQTGTNHSLRN